VLGLTVPAARVAVIVVDDASTDDSCSRVRDFQARDRRIHLHRMPVNVGTHVARLTAVSLVRTPFLTFLDPDDEFFGHGVRRALQWIAAFELDVAEFSCRMIIPRKNRTDILCWRPPKVYEAAPSEFRQMFYDGVINCHLHRKIFRTEIYRQAIAAMPPWVRRQRIIRFEDKLHFAFIVNAMTRPYMFVNAIGEIRYYGLADNSMSATYQSIRQSTANERLVDRIINQSFHVIPR
jgi:glycosyltransferase involved in cell wall biosynthesis